MNMDAYGFTTFYAKQDSPHLTPAYGTRFMILFHTEFHMGFQLSTRSKV